ncbi:MAG: Holliday junction branch migration protein RuvA [Desulfuromonadaceae bacterium]|nr:Holliday junction branch migration protein RuvA [Desulfuromonas sp.]MDY0185905.1 Holliday junction branch migration protein RuvA [Desulfuromonadaceae bacterium]
MIALLTGTMRHKSPEHVIIEANGVGYSVDIPLSSYYGLPEEGQATLYIHTHVREDTLRLYGFLTLAEKETFILLIGISGIGPKAALNILSHMSCADLHQALFNEDVARLTTVPGIGKKTAERLILELHEKIRKLATAKNSLSKEQEPLTPALRDSSADALSALISLGYKEKQARGVLEKMHIDAHTSTQEILKQALQHLTR